MNYYQIKLGCKRNKKKKYFAHHISSHCDLDIENSITFFCFVFCCCFVVCFLLFCLFFVRLFLCVHDTAARDETSSGQVWLQGNVRDRFCTQNIDRRTKRALSWPGQSIFFLQMV